VTKGNGELSKAVLTKVSW